MKTTTIDFYSGFEGEPEMTFIRRNISGKEFTIQIWVGYFHDIMACATPSTNGWKGLALQYHTCEGWYETSPWKVTNLRDVVDEWMLLDTTKLEKRALPIWMAIADLFQEAIDLKDEIWILYD